MGSCLSGSLPFACGREQTRTKVPHHRVDTVLRGSLGWLPAALQVGQGSVVSQVCRATSSEAQTCLSITLGIPLIGWGQQRAELAGALVTARPRLVGPRWPQEI